MACFMFKQINNQLRKRYMKMNKSILLGIMLLFGSVNSINAQSAIVPGKVTAFNNLPLANVEVTIKKSKKTVMTNT